jgi:hypothetical protein
MSRPQDFELANGQALHLGKAQGQILRCVRGRIWITLAGDGDDYFLDAGQTMQLPGGGARVVIEGMGASRCQVVSGSVLAAVLRRFSTRRQKDPAPWAAGSPA